MINSAWVLRPIGDLFAISAGKTMSATAREGSDKTPFLRTSNVLWDEIDVTTVDSMTITPQELQGKILSPGDLLVCEGGDIGRAAIWNGETPLMSFQNHLHRLRPISQGIEPRFYVFFLQSAFTQLGIFEGAGNKTTIPNLSRNRLAALEVPHPTLREQQAVVSVLAHVRKAIRSNNGSIALANGLRSAVMSSLFTRGLRGEAQKETDFGSMPISWQACTIGTFARQMQYGLSLRGEPSGQYPILRMNCQRDGKVVLRDLQYVTLDDKTAEAFRVKPGDILFNRTNSYELVGRTAIVDSDMDAVFASYLVRVSVNAEFLDPRYLNHFLNWGKAQGELKKLASRGVSQANISASKLRAFVIPLPSLGEQQEIVAVLDAIDSKLDLHRRKRAVLDDLFKVLLRKLMTGEIRVADLNLSALESNAEPVVAS